MEFASKFIIFNEEEFEEEIIEGILKKKINK